MRAQITGQATRTHPMGTVVFTPKGYQDNCGDLRITINGGWSECSPSRYGATAGEVKLYGVIYPSLCTDFGTVCATFSGGFDGRYDRLDASLKVWPTDTTLRGGTGAIIRWRADPDSLQGIVTPLTAKRVFFEPDSSGALADSAVSCGTGGGYFYQTNSCTIATRASGTLHVWAIVNGKLDHKTAHITVPTLQLKATPAYGKKGDSITFTPVWSDGAAVTQTPDSWGWAPDSAPGATQACSAPSGSHACRTRVQESGTMTVRVTANGLARTASAHVTIVPCPTGDSILDHPDVRQAMDSIWRLSNADSANRDIRRERVLTVYDSGGTMVVRILQLDSAATPCSTHRIEPVPPPGTLLAAIHVHPFAIGDSLPPSCNDPNDPPPPGTHLAYGYGYGGLSANDWTNTQTVPKHTEFAFDRDSVYRADPSSTFTTTAAGKDIPDSSSVANKRGVWPRHGNGCSIVKK